MARIIAFAACLLVFPACNSDLIFAVLDPPGEGTVDLFVQVEPKRDLAIEGLALTVARVDVVVQPVGATGEEIVTVAETEQRLQLPSASFGVPILLMRALVPAGEIRQVRLVLSAAELRLAGSTEQLEAEVVVPSGQQTGIKAIPRHGASVTVAAGDTARALTTVDLATQLHRPPGRGFALKPTADLTALARAAVSDFVRPGELVLTLTTSTYPETGVRLERAKAIDQSTGMIRDIVIDAQGVPQDLLAVRAAEEAAYRAAHGLVERALLEDVAMLDDAEPLTLLVLAATPTAPPFVPRGGALWQRDAARAAYRDERVAANRPFVDGLASALEAAGGTVLESEYDPATMAVSVARGVLLNQIAFLPGVAAIDLHRPREPLGFLSARDLVEEVVHPAYRGLPLSPVDNVRIVIDELDCADVSHRFFADAFTEPNAPGSTLDEHPTLVMSIAAGNFGGGALAGAYRAVLRSTCAGSFGAVLAAGPDVLNKSVAEAEVPGTLSRMQDEALFMRRFMLTKGAGNDDTAVADCYTYNAICVGGYDDGFTNGLDPVTRDDRFLEDDTPAFSYQNFDWTPQGMEGSHREEPRLVARAINVSGAGLGGRSVQGDGTSYAAPAVAGLAGLLMTLHPELVDQATAVRALLMASADHDVDGIRVPLFGDIVDDRDGAGAPRADRAEEILAAGQLEFGILVRDADFSPSGEKVLTFDAVVGQVVRVVLTWDVCPYTDISTFDHLTIDLDLVVEGPPIDPGAPSPFLKSNPSTFDNYEIVEFFVPATGTWKIRIRAPRWEGCRELDVFGTGARVTYYGIAWDIKPFEP